MGCSFSRNVEHTRRTLLLLPDGTEKDVGCLRLDEVQNPQEKWPMSTDEKYVFVSHAGLDKDGGVKMEDRGVKEDIARPTHWFLTSVLKVKAFLDDESIRPGRPKMEELIAPAYQCTLALVILSPAYRKRKYCVRELNTFMRRWKNRDGIHVLPALFEMDNLDGYHAEVSDLTWIRYNGSDRSASHPPDFMVHKLWPALVRELGFDPVSNSELEEHLCRYVKLHRGRGFQIPVHLHTFVDRKRGTWEDSGHSPSRMQELQPNSQSPKVIDVFFAFHCSRSSLLHNLNGRPQLLADIDKICDYLEKDGLDNAIVGLDMKDFLSRDYHVCFSDGRGSYLENALKSRVRVFVWFAKGVDELHVTSKEFIADLFGGSDKATIEVLVVCMEYGAKRTAKVIYEEMKNRVGRVVWMQMDPCRDNNVDGIFKCSLLPFCAHFLHGNKRFDGCMEAVKGNHCTAYGWDENDLWHSQEYPARRSGVPPTVSKQMSSSCTIGFFQSRKLRQLKVAAKDLDLLDPTVEDDNLIMKLSKGQSHRCTFFVPKEGEEFLPRELEKFCRRSRALTLYTINEISSCIESGRRMDAFHDRILRVACKKDKESTEEELLKGKGRDALLWLDFVSEEMTKELFPNANAITARIDGFGDKSVLSLVFTSTGNHFGHVETVRIGLDELIEEDGIEVDCLELPCKAIEARVPATSLLGTIKILPLKGACILDRFQDGNTMVMNIELALFGDTHDGNFCSVTSLYRDDDGSVIVGVLIREVKFLTTLRDRTLGGQAAGALRTTNSVPAVSGAPVERAFFRATAHRDAWTPVEFECAIGNSVTPKVNELLYLHSKRRGIEITSSKIN